MPPRRPLHSCYACAPTADADQGAKAQTGKTEALGTDVWEPKDGAPTEAQESKKGGLAAQEIMKVIRANLNQVRHCYEEFLERTPDGQGKITVRFVVGSKGAVTGSCINEATTTLKETTIHACIAAKIKKWTFPEPRSGMPVTVNYPFMFNPL